MTVHWWVCQRSQVKYPKPPEKIIFSERLRKILFSDKNPFKWSDTWCENSYQCPLTAIPSLSQPLPQDVIVIRRRKHRQKSTNRNISEGRYFPSSDSWGDRENSEAGESEQALQSEAAHSTLPLILAQGSKWKSKKYISFQNKERGEKVSHSLSTFDSWLVVDAGEGGCSVLSTSFSFFTLSTLTSVVLLGGIILPLKHCYYYERKARDCSCFFHLTSSLFSALLEQMNSDRLVSLYLPDENSLDFLFFFLPPPFSSFPSFLPPFSYAIALRGSKLSMVL